MIVNTDIDIDFLDRESALNNLLHIPASMVVRGERVKHNSGVYFQDIPVDPADGLAVYEYNDAEKRGYFKIDFLGNSIYEGVCDEQHLIDLMTTEPMWEMLGDESIVNSLAHLRDHFGIVLTIIPNNLDDLAVCLALIRPGKRHLVGKPRHEIDAEIWLPCSDYYFKRSHSYAFAASIIVQMNLLVEQAKLL